MTYHFLGTDPETESGHYYRYTPTHAEILRATPQSNTDTEDPNEFADRWQLTAGDPKTAVQRYSHQNHINHDGELVDHSYRHLDDPEYTNELNTGLGGSLLLDEEYTLPFRLEFDKISSILEQEAKSHDDIFVDYRPQYIELTPSEAVEKYRLLPELRGNNEITGTEILDRIHVLDRGSEEQYTEMQVDDLARHRFIDELEPVVDDQGLAEALIDEYRNLRTVSWAATSDVAHLENTWGLDAHDLFKQLGEKGVYRSEHSPDAGRLHLPERKQPDSGEDVELGEGSEQAGFSDF